MCFRGCFPFAEAPRAFALNIRSRSQIFLDAFVVSLDQASEGEGRKGWYTSTLELQLASLELYKACRRVSTLRVRVDNVTPRSLRAFGDLDSMASEVPSSTISSRVPLVRALGLTRSLSTDALQELSSTPKHV